MSEPEILSFYALGPVQVIRGQRLCTDWAYLDSEELLFYLLLNTHRPKCKDSQATIQTGNLRGKTKEQIGLDLWPDASTQQLNSKLKSRLYDLRRSLGKGEWIVFENGQYKFNYTLPYWFDVEIFSQQIAEAESHRAGSPAEAIPKLQQAISLYRGDFLEGMRQRRTRQAHGLDKSESRGEREWYITEQEVLSGAYLDALHKIGKLLAEARNFAQATETYRRIISKDDYDDEAHYELIMCLASQGKRSQVLEYYRNLLKRRVDIPPGPEIAAVIERVRRGEDLAPRPTEATIATGVLPTVAQTSGAPFQAPADLQRFVGRERELSAISAMLTHSDKPRRYCLAGMGGIGKTSLAVHLAHLVRDQFPAGVLWAHASSSEPLAILDSWARAYQCDFSGLPDLASRAAALRAVLYDKHILMILDDVWSLSRARSLLVGGPQSAVLITSRDLDIAGALDAQIIQVPVFAVEESLQVLSRTVGEERVVAESAAADEICQLLGHLPLALDIAAHRLASRPSWLLRELTERLRVQCERLAELKIDDYEVRASFAISWEALDEVLRRVFSLLGVFEGRAITAAALAAVAEVDERSARDNMDSLVALSLLSTDGHLHYRQHPLLADFAREHLTDAEYAEARMARYYLRYAAEQRQNYLALEEDWDNLAAGLDSAYQQKMWQELIDYGDVLTNAWFARGRFTYARQAYPAICEAARALEEQDPYIAATINWGRACIEQGDFPEAKERLQHALRVSQDVNDRHNIASAQVQLAVVAIHQADYDECWHLLLESQRLREQLGDQIGIAETLILQARLHYRHYNYVEMEQLATQALDILKTTERFQSRIEVLRLLAMAAGHQGHHNLADRYCQEAMKLCDDTQYQAELPSVLYAWMQLCWRRGDYDLASQYGERSVALFKTTGDRKSLAYALEYLMRVYLDLREYGLAEEKGQQSLALLHELQDEWSIVYALRGLGKLYRETRRPDRARQSWLDALQRAEKLSHPLKQELQALLEQS